MPTNFGSPMMDNPSFDSNPDAMRQQLEVLFPQRFDQPDGLIEMAWTDPEPDATGRYALSQARLFRLDQKEELIEQACRLNKREMCNVYVGPALRKPDTPLHGRTSDGAFSSVRVVWADLDDPGSAERAIGLWAAAPPSFVVQTGQHPHRRWQAWWSLDAWEYDPEVLKEVMRRISNILDSDPSVVQVGRVMRLAGSIAWPTKKGRVPELTSIISASGREYRLDHVAESFRYPAPLGLSSATFRDPAPRASNVVREIDENGREGKVIDGRETYMRNVICAVLLEMMATDQSIPSKVNLFEKAWPIYERSTDLTREGRGRNEFLAKCGRTLQRCERGAIAGMRTLEEAIETYNAKRMAEFRSDFEDLGEDVVVSLSVSETAVVTRQPSIANHPLLKFIPYDGNLQAPRMILPGLIEHGTCIIAGQAGIGKTTTIIAMACMIAGIHKPGDPLRPRHWRYIIIISEDTGQVKRCLFAIEQELGFRQEIIDRIQIVDAVRMTTAEFVKVGQPYEERFTRVVAGVRIPPLVICDTKAAIFAATDENDNAETSAMMAGLKQNFSNLPVWVIGHVSKSNMNRTSAREITLRGASSAEGDANQTVFLVRDENGRRFLVLGKTRFEPDYREVELHSFTTTTVALDEYGELIPTVLRRVELLPLTEAHKAERAAIAKAEQEAAKRKARNESAEMKKVWAIDIVKERRIRQDPLNRTALKDELVDQFSLGKERAFKLIKRWVDDGVFGEVEIPTEVAANNNKRMFLIELTEDEGFEWVKSRALPPEKSNIPGSWIKRPKKPT